MIFSLPCWTDSVEESVQHLLPISSTVALLDQWEVGRKAEKASPQRLPKDWHRASKKLFWPSRQRVLRANECACERMAAAVGKGSGWLREQLVAVLDLDSVECRGCVKASCVR